jgi:hypothetical protein
MKTNIDLRLLIDNSVEERIDINKRNFNDNYINRFTALVAHSINNPIYKDIFRDFINPSCYHVPNYHENHLKNLLK